jgi:hypothetical protein
VHAGHTAQVAAHAQNVSQHQETGLVDIDKLLAAATAVSEILPLLGLPEQQRSDVERAAEEIAAEAENPLPDHGKLHRAAEVLKTLLPLAQSAATTANMIAADVHTALH